MGPQVPLKENAAKVGVSRTAPFNQVFEVVKDAQRSGRTVHFLPSYRGDNKLLLEKLLGLSAQTIKDHASFRITSYNVCYTKLLRILTVFSYKAVNPQDKYETE